MATNFSFLAEAVVIKDHHQVWESNGFISTESTLISLGHCLKEILKLYMINRTTSLLSFDATILKTESYTLGLNLTDKPEVKTYDVLSDVGAMLI